MPSTTDSDLLGVVERAEPFAGDDVEDPVRLWVRLRRATGNRAANGRRAIRGCTDIVGNGCCLMGEPALARVDVNVRFGCR